MRLKLFVVLLLLVPVGFAFYSGQTADYTGQPNADTAINPLAAYGEYVYIREKCRDCHSLSISDTLKFISLDGIAGKYPNSWHYNHLIDPSSVRPNSSMPSFAKLDNRQLDSGVFVRIIPGTAGNISAATKAMLWTKLQHDADSVRKTIYPNSGAIVSQTEMIALIAFLQSIPPGPEKKRQDSVARANYDMQAKLWASTMLDSNSILIRTALRKDQNAIDSGATVFGNYCTPCHGANAGGMIGPNLTDQYWLHGNGVTDIAKTISFGIPEKGMRPWRYDLKPVEIGQVIAYIYSLQGTQPNNAKDPQGEKR